MSSCEFGENLFRGYRDISYTNKKSRSQCQKQNLTHFTACGTERVTVSQIIIGSTAETCHRASSPVTSEESRDSTEVLLYN